MDFQAFCLSVSVLNDASSVCFELRSVFGRVGFVSVGFSAEKQKYGGSFVLFPVRGSFLWWLPWQNQWSAADGGLLSVCHIFIYSCVGGGVDQPLFSPSFILSNTGIYIPSRTEKKLWPDTRASGSPPKLSRNHWMEKKKSSFSDWFCLLSHGSPQTFKLSDWWDWLLFWTNGICMASQYGSGHEYYSGKLCICGIHSDPPERFGTISIQMLMRFLGSRCRILKVSPCTGTISHQAPAAGAAGSLAEESDIYRKPSWNWITNR